NNLIVVGKGSSELEDILAPIAQGQQRVLVEEINPAGGFYFRSDHFNFAKAGVPALYIKSGGDLVDGGLSAGQAADKDYFDNRYHKPGDQYDAATWKLEGVLDDLNAVYGVGRELTGSDTWPNWYKSNPFKAARDKMLTGKSGAVPAQ
ncbi:MAG: M28 family peptidase, partial [Luteimonas sp.]